jgi:hypothetical protein
MSRLSKFFILVGVLLSGTQGFANDHISSMAIPEAFERGQRQEVGTPMGTSISSVALHDFMDTNQFQIQNSLNQDRFLNLEVTPKQFTVDGHDVIPESTLACLRQRSGQELPPGFSVGTMITALESLKETGINDRCSREISNAFNIAISVRIASSMGAVPSLVRTEVSVQESLVCVEEGLCGPFVRRPVFPILNLAARAALFPFRVAGAALVGLARVATIPFRVVANGIAFRQDLRAERAALGLDVASVQSLPFLGDRINARIARRQLGLSLFPGPRRLARRLNGF